MIQDLSGSWCIKGTGESMTVDSPVPLMHHDPNRSWITDPDPDHPKGTHPKIGSDCGCQSKEIGVGMEVRLLSVGVRGFFLAGLRLGFAAQFCRP